MCSWLLLHFLIGDVVVPSPQSQCPSASTRTPGLYQTEKGRSFAVLQFCVDATCACAASSTLHTSRLLKIATSSICVWLCYTSQCCNATARLQQQKPLGLLASCSWCWKLVLATKQVFLASASIVWLFHPAGDIFPRAHHFRHLNLEP